MTSADLRPSRPEGPAGPARLAVAHVADLQLRGRSAPVATRVYWPAPCAAGQPASGTPATSPATGTAIATATARRTALVLLVAGPDTAGERAGADRIDALARGLCTYAGTVVLSPLRPESDAVGLRDATTALDWAADHATELGADPRRLVVAGWASGAAVAAALARRATEQGWPPIARQLLICPGSTAAFPPGSLAGVAPATVVTTGRVGDDDGDDSRGVGCGAWLREAGVRVDELRYEGLPAGEPGWTPWTAEADLVMADLARSLQHRLGLPPTVATRFVPSGDDDGGDDRDDDDEAGVPAGEIRSTGGGFV